MDITGLAGSLVESSSAQVPGITDIGAMAGDRVGDRVGDMATGVMDIGDERAGATVITDMAFIAALLPVDSMGQLEADSMAEASTAQHFTVVVDSMAADAVDVDQTRFVTQIDAIREANCGDERLANLPAVFFSVVCEFFRAQKFARDLRKSRQKMPTKALCNNDFELSDSSSVFS